jgi:hypothetical protein
MSCAFESQFILLVKRHNFTAGLRAVTIKVEAMDNDPDIHKGNKGFSDRMNKTLAIIGLTIMLFFTLLIGCSFSNEIKTQCQAVKAAEKTLSSAVIAEIKMMGSDRLNDQAWFVDFSLSNGVTSDQLGIGWTFNDNTPSGSPGYYNLLIIDVDSANGNILSKLATNGVILGYPGFFVDCQ